MPRLLILMLIKLLVDPGPLRRRRGPFLVRGRRSTGFRCGRGRHLDEAPHLKRGRW